MLRWSSTSAVAFGRGSKIGEPVGEPSWKRNVRNVLQQMKSAGELVNSERNAWRLPSPDVALRLDQVNAWNEVKSAAEKAYSHGAEFHSAKQERRYRVAGVSEGTVAIQRIDSPGPESVTRGEVERAIRYLNAAGGRVGRRTVNYTVAKEVAIVYLHPRLRWSPDHEWIQVIGGVHSELAVTSPSYTDFGQAPDDDPARLQRFARRVRAGQAKFRENLLRLYGERCAVTGWGPAEVLEAAHVLWHAGSGLNHTDNGILLRADLHVLFDEGLLRIDPERLVVMLDRSLKGTPYAGLNGTLLRLRLDGSQPRTEYLRTRWSTPRSDGRPA